MLRIFENNPISLLRAVQCTKYDLWTRTVDYRLAQLSVRADRKKGSLGNHKNVDSGNVMQKSFVVYSNLMFIIIRAKRVPIMLEPNCYERFGDNKKKTCRQVTSSMQLQNRSFQGV